MSKTLTIQTYRPGDYGVGSREISPPKLGESGIRRLANFAEELVQRPLQGINTVYDVVTDAVLKHGDKAALGWREIVKTIEEEREVIKAEDQEEVEKKQWTYFELSEYKWMSYNDVKAAVSEISRGLIKHGISKGDVFNIHALTSPNWQLVSQGCLSVSITIATDTLGESGLLQSLNEPECVGVFTNAEFLPTLLRLLPKAASIKLVVYDGKPEPKLLDDLAAVRDTTKVTSVDELRALGRAEPTAGLEERLPKKEDMAVIMYTSGSTGDAKGVVLTHANLVASIGAVQTLVGHYWQDDTYLAYLPLSHVLEFTIELIFFFAGVRIGYGNVRTLTDASVRNCKGDICALAPSVMVGVPTFWETIRKGILTKANADGSFKKTKFHKAVWAKKNMPIFSPLAEKGVLSKIQAAIGGRLRIAISTGAAISQETQMFLSAALVKVIQAYSITESSGICAILPPELHHDGVVGLPIPSVEIKLLDIPHTRYSVKGNPQQGEICIRGPSVTSCYFKRPILNSDKTVFAEDGWLRTGDIGQWNSDGTLSLIDRLENLVKMNEVSNEYIALERLEAIYKACKLVHNICVYATPGKQPLAIVIPHSQLLRNYLAKRGSLNYNRELAILCRDHNIKEIIRKECNVIGRKNGFRQFELLQAVVLTAEEWTPENGFVTAMQQIRRDKLAVAFKSQIDEIYLQGRYS